MVSSIRSWFCEASDCGRDMETSTSTSRVDAFLVPDRRWSMRRTTRPNRAIRLAHGGLAGARGRLRTAPPAGGAGLRSLRAVLERTVLDLGDSTFPEDN